MYYTYVLRNLKDNQSYPDLTRDLKQRFEQKNYDIIKERLKSYVTG